MITTSKSFNPYIAMHDFCRFFFIFTHLKSWIASAIRNLKWVNISITYFFEFDIIRSKYCYWE